MQGGAQAKLEFETLVRNSIPPPNQLQHHFNKRYKA
ncbi:MAG: hypothetical protein ACI856_001177 [Kiritimatiellia bacterium]